MWIQTNKAFLSIVQDRTNKDRFVVRSRIEGDIETIFPNAEVIRTPKGDYLFRAFIDKNEVATKIAEQLLSIDYENFKKSVECDKRHDAYLKIWQTMYNWQEDERDDPWYLYGQGASRYYTDIFAQVSLNSEDQAFDKWLQDQYNITIDTYDALDKQSRDLLDGEFEIWKSFKKGR